MELRQPCEAALLDTLYTSAALWRLYEAILFNLTLIRRFTSDVHLHLLAASLAFRPFTSLRPATQLSLMVQWS
jgi:hypothetical protein